MISPLSLSRALLAEPVFAAEPIAPSDGKSYVK